MYEIVLFVSERGVVMMGSAVIDIVIDERTQFKKVQEAAVLNQRQFNNTQRVFRDYILSSEPFQLETHLN